MSQRVDLAALSRRRVLDARGQPIGRLEEVQLDFPEGRILSLTLVLKAQAKGPPNRIRIPWSQFSLAPDGTHLALNISLDVLRTVARRQGGGSR